MSSLKPPLDHQGTPREPLSERREEASQPQRTPSGKRKPHQRDISPDAAELNLKHQRSHERLGRVTDQLKGLMTPVAATSAPRVKLNPAQRAERNLQTFAKLLEPSSPHELAHLAEQLLPLTDHAEGFKCFSATMPDGTQFKLAHHEGDAQLTQPPQHIEMAMFLSFMLVKQKHLPAAQWREHLRASPHDKKVPSTLLRAGSRLSRRNGRFLLSPSSTFDLPTPNDPSYDDYVQLHVNFLRGVGAEAISPLDAGLEHPPTPPPSSPSSDGEGSQTSAKDEPPKFGSGVAAMCQAINERLARAKGAGEV